MAGYVCPSCGTEDPVFGEGGGARLAEHFGVPLLASIPIVPAVREGGDRGVPLVAADPGHPVARVFRQLAERVAVAAAQAGAAAGVGQPPS
jgi:ATP-binding protein involved in chromosome partitioning